MTSFSKTGMSRSSSSRERACSSLLKGASAAAVADARGAAGAGAWALGSACAAEAAATLVRILWGDAAGVVAASAARRSAPRSLSVTRER